MKKGIKDLVWGDRVYVTGDSSFCDSSFKTIVGIGYNQIYDNKVYKRVIYLDEVDGVLNKNYLVFDGISGLPLTEPTEYFLQII